MATDASDNPAGSSALPKMKREWTESLQRLTEMRRYESEKDRKKSMGVKNTIGVRGFLSLYPVQYVSRLA